MDEPIYSNYMTNAHVFISTIYHCVYQCTSFCFDLHFEIFTLHFNYSVFFVAFVDRVSDIMILLQANCSTISTLNNVFVQQQTEKKYYSMHFELHLSHHFQCTYIKIVKSVHIRFDDPKKDEKMILYELINYCLIFVISCMLGRKVEDSLPTGWSMHYFPPHRTVNSN